MHTVELCKVEVKLFEYIHSHKMSLIFFFVLCTTKRKFCKNLWQKPQRVCTKENYSDDNTMNIYIIYNKNLMVIHFGPW